MPEIIYVLTNEAMPGLVKIGRTSDKVEVPLPFDCHFAAEVDDATHLERTLHQLFSEARINARREFFRVDPERVVLAISIGQFRKITPGVPDIEEEEKEALDTERAKRPRLRLDAIGIKSGNALNFSRDENITATVVDNGHVSLNGERLSLAAATLKVLHGWAIRRRVRTALYIGSLMARS